MKNIFLGALPSVALAFSAHAADIGVYVPMPLFVPAPTWTGLYVGANGGWGWSNINTTVTPFGPVPSPPVVPHPVPTYPKDPTLSSNSDGAVFGGQIGYNWQISSWVLGIEGDFDGASISGTRHLVLANAVAPSTDGFSATVRANWLASIRGRLGYIWGPGMLYFTGGGAWEDVTVDAMLSNGVLGQSAAGSFSKTFSGFVIGGGYEWMVAPNWTVRGEYLFYDFSNGNTGSLVLPNCGALGCGARVSNNTNEINVFRLGVNYKF